MIPRIFDQNEWHDYCGGADHTFEGEGLGGPVEKCSEEHIVILPLEEYIRLKKAAHEYDEESGPLEVN